MTNLGNYTFESIVREMTVGMNEYNVLAYATAKVVTESCSPKKKSKCQKETIMETENGKENRTSTRRTIYTECVREGHKCKRKNV